MGTEGEALDFPRRPGEAELSLVLARQGQQHLGGRLAIDRGIQLAQDLPQFLAGFFRSEKFQFLRRREARHSQGPHSRQPCGIIDQLRPRLGEALLRIAGRFGQSEVLDDPPTSFRQLDQALIKGQTLRRVQITGTTPECRCVLAQETVELRHASGLE